MELCLSVISGQGDRIHKWSRCRQREVTGRQPPGKEGAGGTATQPSSLVPSTRPPSPATFTTHLPRLVHHRSCSIAACRAGGPRGETETAAGPSPGPETPRTRSAQSSEPARAPLPSAFSKPALGRRGKLPGGESHPPQGPGLVCPQEVRTCSGFGRNVLPPASSRLLSGSAA